MLSIIGGDRERLLHKTIRFISVSVWATIGVTFVSRYTIAIRIFVEIATSAFAFHLAICEEAAGDTAGTPRLPVRPSSHSSLSLIPNED